jgi:hypothetical protein
LNLIRHSVHRAKLLAEAVRRALAPGVLIGEVGERLFDYFFVDPSGGNANRLAVHVAIERISEVAKAPF